MRHFRLLICGSLFVYAPHVVQAEQSLIEWTKTLGDGASKLAKQLDSPSPLILGVDQAFELAKDQKTVTDKTFIDEKALAKVEDQTQELNNIVVKSPESLNSKTARDHIVQGVNNHGTIYAAYEEMEKLHTAEFERDKQISQLKDARYDADRAADKYQDTWAVADKLSRQHDGLIGYIPLDVTGEVFAGKTFSASAFEFKNDVLPPLSDRATAAKALARRYDDAVKVAEGDLEVFRNTNALLTFFLDGNSATEAFVRSEIRKLAEDIVKQQQTDIAIAKEQEANAAESRSRSAEIDSNLHRFIDEVDAGALRVDGQKGAVDGDQQTETRPATAESREGSADLVVPSEIQPTQGDNSGGTTDQASPIPGADSVAPSVGKPIEVPTIDEMTLTFIKKVDAGPQSGGGEKDATSVDRDEPEMPVDGIKLKGADDGTSPRPATDSAAPDGGKPIEVPPIEDMTQEQWENRLSNEVDRMQAAYLDRTGKPSRDPANPSDKTETTDGSGGSGPPVDETAGTATVDPKNPLDRSAETDASDPPPPGSQAIDPARDPRQPNDEPIDDTPGNAPHPIVPEPINRMQTALATGGGGGSGTLKIGVTGPITGPDADLGAQLVNGAQLAVEDINNRSGGILGQKIELEQRDDVEDPKQGVSAANFFIGDGVRFVIGPYSSNVAKAAANVYAPGYLPHLRPRGSAGGSLGGLHIVAPDRQANSNHI